MTNHPRFEAAVFSDVFAGEYTEDGDRREELAFYVVCEDERGARWASVASFTTQEFSREVAEARANALCERVNDFLAKGHSPVNSSKWARRAGAYGSPAWDERDELRCEARDLEVAGEWQEAARLRREMNV